MLTANSAQSQVLDLSLILLKYEVLEMKAYAM